MIVEQGYTYDASLCPGYASHGGFPSPFLGPHRIRCEAGELAEIPSATMGIGSKRIPYAGGGYLRVLPYRLIRACIGLENRRGRPTNIYVHPRDTDPNQPRMELPLKRGFKYYVGLRSTEAKLWALVRDHRFVSIAAWLAEGGSELEDRVLDVRVHAARTRPNPDVARIPPPPPTEKELTGLRADRA